MKNHTAFQLLDKSEKYATYLSSDHVFSEMTKRGCYWSTYKKGCSLHDFIKRSIEQCSGQFKIC